MQRQSFIIGDKEFQASKIKAFEANGLILKLQKLILPAIGAGGSNLMNMSTAEAFKIISEKLDESVMTDIVFPMFNLSQVACTSESPPFKIDSPKAINQAFGDADGLADLYELIFEVLRYNFGGFFTKLAGRFGSSDGSQKVQE